MTFEQAMQITLTLAEDGMKFWDEHGNAHPDHNEAINLVAKRLKQLGLDCQGEGRTVDEVKEEEELR